MIRFPKAYLNVRVWILAFLFASLLPALPAWAAEEMVSNSVVPAPLPAPTEQPPPQPTEQSPAQAPARKISEKTIVAAEATPTKGTNAASTNSLPPGAPLNSDPAPAMGEMNFSATSGTGETNKPDIDQIQLLLATGREQRHQKEFVTANSVLITIMQTNAPTEFKRLALFELALVAQDEGRFAKAQQIFGQYLHIYPNDPTVPEVLLREGLLYRQMGVNGLAISKFYAVMSSALKLKLDNMDYYKKLVLQAQVEIADTYFLEGKYEDSADFYGRLAKVDEPDLNKAQIQYKLIRSLTALTNNIDTIARSQTYLDIYPNASDVAEVRFMLASALKKLGRNQESMKQVLLLLQSEQENVHKNPETWVYWQQRAGNEIAGQLYKEGDYMNALQIYLSLVDLDKSPAWQLPILYQTALTYEQLEQPQKAQEVYQNIVDHKKDLTGNTDTPGMQSLIDMAKWRKDYIDWLQKAKIANQSLRPNLISLTNTTTRQSASAIP